MALKFTRGKNTFKYFNISSILLFTGENLRIIIIYQLYLCQVKMPLTGILLDVSASMQSSVGSGIDEQGRSWAQSIFKVIDSLIEHDLTSENRVFGIGVGASCTKQIFDIIGTLQ